MAGLILPGEDVHDVARAVQQGDPATGWRGDPGMDTHLGSDGRVGVYGFDRAGDRYLACLVDARNPGWRYELLSRLRDGDWQRADQFDRVDAHNRQIQAEKDAAFQDQKEETAERLAWALKRDLGHLYSGTSKDVY